jgi:hypothetical protein
MLCEAVSAFLLAGERVVANSVNTACAGSTSFCSHVCILLHAAVRRRRKECGVACIIGEAGRMRVACYTCVNKQVIASNPSSGAATLLTPCNSVSCTLLLRRHSNVWRAQASRVPWPSRL